MEQTKQILNVRIHVEWVVGNMYSLLSATQPIEFVSSADETTTFVCVACALINPRRACAARVTVVVVFVCHYPRRACAARVQ